MKRWIFLTNVFLNTSKYSYKTAFTISNYHDAQLQANKTDPFFGPLFLLYHPLHVALEDAYTAWQAQGNQRSGSTLSLDQLFALLSPTKSNYWEYKIIGIFPKDSPQYKVLFPLGLKPFYSGTKESKINAVKTLAKSTKNYGELEEVYNDIDHFYTDLKNARTTQLGNKGITTDKSVALENVIRTAMIEMYANLGLCMHHYKEDPIEAASFFDLATIRSRDQLKFTRTLKEGKQKNVLNHTFFNGDRVNVINDGNADLVFYLAPQKNSSKGGLLSVTVTKNTTLLINMGDLNIVNTFLNVVNETANDGHCIIELV